MTPEQFIALAATINGIICAGLEGFGNPLFVIYDPAGNLTGLDPAKMSPVDVVEFVRHYYGDDIARRTAAFQQLTMH
jgi:hypothetical protein